MTETTFWADVGDAGRVTIPVSTRKALELRKGDSIHLLVLEIKKETADREDSPQLQEVKA